MRNERFAMVLALIGAACSGNVSQTERGAAGSGTAVAPASSVSTAAGSGGRVAAAPTQAQAGMTAVARPPASSAGSTATPAAGSGSPASTATAGSRASMQPAQSTSTTAGTSASMTAAAGMGGSAAAGQGGGADSATDLEKFSFFVTSLAGLQRLSKSQDGFGGDLRYGQADGLSGADKICSELAEASMPGAAAKGWHAFLSASAGPDGKAVNAIDRVGEGPWYDRLGRVLAMNKAALANPRPKGADPAIANDLPNEDGVPNKQPDPSMEPVNNHHFLTGSDASGKLYMNAATSTCHDWTSKDKGAGRPRIGFSYPAGNRENWLSGQDEGGCGAGKVLVDMGGSDPNNPIVGSGGGYGGFYCFALKP